mgnify:CR=1 FL=1
MSSFSNNSMSKPNLVKASHHPNEVWDARIVFSFNQTMTFDIKVKRHRQLLPLPWTHLIQCFREQFFKLLHQARQPLVEEKPRYGVGYEHMQRRSSGFPWETWARTPWWGRPFEVWVPSDMTPPCMSSSDYAEKNYPEHLHQKRVCLLRCQLPCLSSSSPKSPSEGVRCSRSSVAISKIYFYSRFCLRRCRCSHQGLGGGREENITPWDSVFLPSQGKDRVSSLYGEVRCDYE